MQPVCDLSTPQNVKHPSLHLPDVWQEGEGQEEARHKTADVGKVVDPRKQTEGEEEDWDGQQLGESPPRSLEDLPALKQLHKQTGQDAELAACRAHLRRSRGNKLLTRCAVYNTSWVQIWLRKVLHVQYSWSAAFLRKSVFGVICPRDTVPLLCRAGRWMRPSCLWCRLACRWWRFSASPPASLCPSAPSSGKTLTQGSAGSYRHRQDGYF